MKLRRDVNVECEKPTSITKRVTRDDSPQECVGDPYFGSGKSVRAPIIKGGAHKGASHNNIVGNPKRTYAAVVSE